MTCSLQRQALVLEPAQATHAGHVLSCGLQQWEGDPTIRGERHAKFIRDICKIQPSDCYTQAFERWKQLIDSSKNIAQWEGCLETRLYIGTGNPTSVEANISIHQTYGTPLISGSAIKGLLRAYAKKNKIDHEVINVIFGEESKADQMSNAGYLIFHDAWWVPESTETPFVPEIVTVHHSNYYKTKGEIAATDFDSPNPNPQICAQGKFVFAIEGSEMWVSWAIGMLVHALTKEGIGGKLSSGYGLFINPESEKLETKDESWGDASLQWIAGKNQLIATSRSVGKSARIDIENDQLESFLGFELSKSKKNKLKKGLIYKKVNVLKKGNIFKLTKVINEGTSP